MYLQTFIDGNCSIYVVVVIALHPKILVMASIFTRSHCRSFEFSAGIHVVVDLQYSYRGKGNQTFGQKFCACSNLSMMFVHVCLTQIAEHFTCPHRTFDPRNKFMESHTNSCCKPYPSLYSILPLKVTLIPLVLKPRPPDDVLLVFELEAVADLKLVGAVFINGLQLIPLYITPLNR